MKFLFVVAQVFVMFTWRAGYGAEGAVPLPLVEAALRGGEKLASRHNHLDCTLELARASSPHFCPIRITATNRSYLGFGVDEFKGVPRGRLMLHDAKGVAVPYTEEGKSAFGNLFNTRKPDNRVPLKMEQPHSWHIDLARYFKLSPGTWRFDLMIASSGPPVDGEKHMEDAIIFKNVTLTIGE